MQKLDALFAIEREMNGRSPTERYARRKELSAPLMAELHDSLNLQLGRISRNHDLAKAINYMLRRWAAFTRFLADGRVCLPNNAAERALRCVPLGRKSWLFCGSDRGGQRAAVAYSLIQTCWLNNVDPQAWLADILARIADHPVAASKSSCRGTGGALGSPWQPDGPRQQGPFCPNHRPRRSGSRQNRKRCSPPTSSQGMSLPTLFAG